MKIPQIAINISRVVLYLYGLAFALSILAYVASLVKAYFVFSLIIFLFFPVGWVMFGMPIYFVFMSVDLAQDFAEYENRTSWELWSKYLVALIGIPLLSLVWYWIAFIFTGAIGS